MLKYYTLNSSKPITNWSEYLGSNFLKPKSIKEVRTEGAVYQMCITEEQRDKLSKLDNTQSLKEEIPPQNFVDLDYFPHDVEIPNSLYEVKPMILPRKNEIYRIDETNKVTFFHLIKRFENSKISLRSDGLYLNNKRITSYRFSNNYYYMIGDNRATSYDSRFWGPVPEIFILGKAEVIYYSRNNTINWERFFKRI